jgi:hypothetical protein
MLWGCQARSCVALASARLHSQSLTALAISSRRIPIFLIHHFSSSYKFDDPPLKPRKKLGGRPRKKKLKELAEIPLFIEPLLLFSLVRCPRGVYMSKP